MMRIKDSIWKFLNDDWHFLLLVIFFVSHGYAEYGTLISLKELGLLLVVMVVAAMMLFWLGKLFFKERRKAALFMSLFLTIFLFFGAFQDFLGKFHATSAIAQLRIFVPLAVIVIIVGLIALKKMQWRFGRLRVFLNALLVIYILIDVFSILYKLIAPSQQHSFSFYGMKKCDTCAKPPIYFILMDEYSGSDALKQYFNYDNSRFESFLQREGFNVNRHTNSNYLLTVFSVASTLNMDFIHGLGKASPDNHFGYRKAVKLISDNAVMNFMKAHGYRINNYSYLRLPDAPPVFKADYLPGEIDLITNKTLYSRIANNLRRVMVHWFRNAEIMRRQDDFYINNNEAMITGVLNEARRQQQQPAFTYMHLMMPHEPIAFDSTGRRITPFWARGKYTQNDFDNAYLQYLVYTNNRMRSFISELKKATKGKAIIILMSDHGYRRIPIRTGLAWQTFNAVYLPQQQYNKWYDGVTNVNQFRVLLNTAFGQQLPMLSDSLIKQ
jgi:hypothetical protein